MACKVAKREHAQNTAAMLDKPQVFWRLVKSLRNDSKDNDTLPSMNDLFEKFSNAYEEADS